MPADSASDLTTVLQAAADGDRDAAARLLPLVYDELRRLAQARLGRIPPGQTLQPTALVHEAFLKLVGSQDPGWNGRQHFFAAAARAMRNILVDHARRKGSLKRGGDRQRVTDEFAEPGFEEPKEDLLALNEALEQLEAVDPRKADIVMLRYFAGLTPAETAAALSISERTLEREWRYARAWLRRRMDADPPAAGPGGASDPAGD